MQRILYADGIIRSFQCRSRNYQHWVSDKPNQRIVAKSLAYGTRLAIGNSWVITEYGKTEHGGDDTYKLFGDVDETNYALAVKRHPLASEWVHSNLTSRPITRSPNGVIKV